MRQRQRQLPNMSAARPPEPAFAIPYQSDPEFESGPGFSVVQILTVAHAHWRISLGIALLFTALSGFAIKLLPKTYTATATLIVNTENKDPLAGQQFPGDVLGNYVATQTELMTSPVILLQVVDQLKLTEDPRFARSLASLDPSARRESVEKSLSSDLLIETGRGGQLLYINASARESPLAADIANAVADVYLSQQRQRLGQPAGERAQRYSEELAELRAKAAAAQDKVTEFRKNNGITDLNSGNQDSQLQALTSLQSKLLDAQSVRRALEAKRSGQRATTDEALGSNQVSTLRSQIGDLEAQLAQKRATLGERHPQVLELKSHLEATRHSLDVALSELSQNNATELARARDLEDKLNRAIAEERQKVLGLHQVEGEGEKLMLELESAQAVYKRALDGYDQIMFASSGNNTNVSVISRATPPLKPSKPNKIKYLAFATIFGLVIGLAIPVGYELFVNPRIRCRDDIERDFKIPVLAQFGAIDAAVGAT